MEGSAVKDYDDIPGTYIFDGRRSRQGYALNMFCMSLNQVAGRDAFRANPAAYLNNYDLTPEQRDAVEDRDWLKLLHLGGNIYYTYKLAAYDGLNMQDVGALMSNVTTAEFSQMMIDGGRPIEGNRRTGEDEDGETNG